MRIPKEVKKAAAWHLRAFRWKVSIVYLGKYQGSQAYTLKFRKNMTVGYPPLFLFDGKSVVEIIDEEGYDIIHPFILVQEIAATYLKMFPRAYVEYLGRNNDSEAFEVVIPYDVTIGWPPVYLFDGIGVKHVLGFESLEVINKTGSSPR